MRAHQEPVFRLAYLFLGDPDDAEDVAQETFIRAFYALHGFDSNRGLRPWLLGIAANTARNKRRSLGRYFAALTRLAGQKMVEDSGQPAEAGYGAERSTPEAGELWAAVRKLSQVDQEAIYFRFFLDLSESEMAAAWDVAQGTVKSRLHRAVERLRAVIAREFPQLREGFEP